MRREAIRATLTQRIGSATDASATATAEATIGTWRKVAVRLAPLIGPRGVDVLFRRALHQTSAAYPWLASAEAYADSAAALASLKARLVGQNSGMAAEASAALLLTFIELLATLIGEALTEHLLSPIWAPQFPGLDQETTQ
jgi:hypothetical protein